MTGSYTLEFISSKCTMRIRLKNKGELFYQYLVLQIPYHTYFNKHINIIQIFQYFKRLYMKTFIKKSGITTICIKM